MSEEDKPKSTQQILKERTLAKAQEVMTKAIADSWDEVWTSKNRITKAGSDSMTIGVSLKLEKIADEQLHVTCGPAWNESHKGSKVGADVSLQGDLFEDDAPDGEHDIKDEVEDNLFLSGGLPL